MTDTSTIEKFKNRKNTLEDNLALSKSRSDKKLGEVKFLLRETDEKLEEMKESLK